MDQAQKDQFHQAFLACLLWSTHDDEDRHLDQEHSISDIDGETSRALRSMTNSFCENNEILLARALQDKIGYGAEQAGHDLALSCNGHGAGFFDRGLGEAGDQLQEAARDIGGVDAYVGDDGKIYAPLAGRAGIRRGP